MEIKSDSELADLSVHELAGYYNTLNEEKNAEISEAIKSKSSKEEVAKLYNEYKKETEAQVEKLNSILIDQGLKIKRLSEMTDGEVALVDGSYKSVKAALKKNVEKLKGLKGNLQTAKENTFNFNTKMTYAGGSAPLGELPQSYREPGVYDERRTNLGFLPYVSQTPISSNVVSYVKKIGRKNQADPVQEANKKPESDFALSVESKFVVKYANRIKVSTEMLDDISFLESEINRELIGNLLEKVDEHCFIGVGGTELDGLLNAGTGYSSGAFAATVTAPNILDVLTVAISEMESVNFYKASAIFMNAADVTKLRLTKDLDNNYQNRLIVTADSMSLGGVPIYTSGHVTAGNFFVCDMSQIRMYVKEDMQVEMGMSGDDFMENLRTILTEWRGVLRIVDPKAVTYGIFDDAIKELAVLA